MQKSIIYTLFLLASFLLLIGCGDRGPKLEPVTGKVTLDGKEISSLTNFKDGSVTFIPEKGRPSYGIIQPDGTFVMKTDNKPGVPAGSYKVTARLVSTEITPSKFNDAPPVMLSAPKYSNETTSGMTQNIPAGGAKNLVFDLTAK